MFHLKENKIIIFDQCLSLEYDIQLTENIGLCQDSKTPANSLFLGKATGLNFIGTWFYNGRKLEVPYKERFYQKMEPISPEEFRSLASRVKEVEIDVDKIYDILEKLNYPSTIGAMELKERLRTLLNGMNSYFSSHPNQELKNSLLLDSIVKENLNSVIAEVSKEIKGA